MHKNKNLLAQVNLDSRFSFSAESEGFASDVIAYRSSESEIRAPDRECEKALVLL